MSKRMQPAGLPIINTRAAAIDIGSRFHVVAVPSDACDEPVRTFQAFTGDLHRMADWLKTVGVTTVAMESTGVYWVPVYEVLEAAGIEVIVANARAMSTMRSGCSACTPAACFGQASARDARSPGCAPTCAFASGTWTTPRRTSSTCRRL